MEIIRRTRSFLFGSKIGRITILLLGILAGLLLMSSSLFDTRASDEDNNSGEQKSVPQFISDGNISFGQSFIRENRQVISDLSIYAIRESLDEIDINYRYVTVDERSSCGASAFFQGNNPSVLAAVPTSRQILTGVTNSDVGKYLCYEIIFIHTVSGETYKAYRVTFEVPPIYKLDDPRGFERSLYQGLTEPDEAIDHLVPIYFNKSALEALFKGSLTDKGLQAFNDNSPIWSIEEYGRLGSYYTITPQDRMAEIESAFIESFEEYLRKTATPEILELTRECHEQIRAELIAEHKALRTAADSAGANLYQIGAGIESFRNDWGWFNSIADFLNPKNGDIGRLNYSVDLHPRTIECITEDPKWGSVLQTVDTLLEYEDRFEYKYAWPITRYLDRYVTSWSTYRFHGHISRFPRSSQAETVKAHFNLLFKDWQRISEILSSDNKFFSVADFQGAAVFVSDSMWDSVCVSRTGGEVVGLGATLDSLDDRAFCAQNDNRPQLNFR